MTPQSDHDWLSETFEWSCNWVRYASSANEITTLYLSYENVDDYVQAVSSRLLGRRVCIQWGQRKRLHVGFVRRVLLVVRS